LKRSLNRKRGGEDRKKKVMGGRGGGKTIGGGKHLPFKMHSGCWEKKKMKRGKTLTFYWKRFGGGGGRKGGMCFGRPEKSGGMGAQGKDDEKLGKS